MRDLIWSHPARRDLFRIVAEYREVDPELPDILLDRLAAAPLALMDFPEIGSPTQHRGVRKWRVRKTPFLLFYAIRHDRIEIRRVVHASSDWQQERL